MSKTIGVVIVVFLLLIEVTLGQSVAMPDHALEDLRSTNLSRANLSVYEEQAVLKLQDVLDYGTIIGSQKYNLELRETALEATLSFFDKAAKLPCAWLSEKKENVRKNNKNWCTPAQLFQALLERPSYELEIGRKNIHVQENLRKISKNSYQGTLVYEQEIKTKKNKNTNAFKEDKTEVIHIQFVLKRMDKQFGNTKEVVWEIKLLGML